MPRKLPKHVQIEKSRHGKPVYYFRRGKGYRVRLPDLESPHFREQYNNAIAGRAVVDVRAMPITPFTMRKQKTERAMRSCLRAARTRSQKRRLPFDLTLDWLLVKAACQDFRCALTGIEFYAKPPNQGKVNPYVPSLDRIEPSKGYVTTNVRIVLRAVNMMLLDWGHEVFEQVANSYRYQRQVERRNSIPSLLPIASRTGEKDQ